MNRGRLAVLVTALGLIGSQAGHLVAYQLRYGPSAQSLQSTGAHGYFPAVVKTGLGLAAAFTLLALLTVGLARLATGRRLQGGKPPALLRTAALLFSLQLGLFIVQETVEGMAGGTTATSPGVLVLWGSLGQLPVAVIAALAVRWLSVRLEPALAQLRARPAPVLRFNIVRSEPVAWPLVTEPVVASELRSIFRRRGPPS